MLIRKNVFLIIKNMMDNSANFLINSKKRDVILLSYIFNLYVSFAIEVNNYL